MLRKTAGIFCTWVLLIFSNALIAQKAIPLSEAVQMAASNYPALKAKALQVEAIKKNIQVVNNTGLPSLDASYQMNYATYNNITGMAYPGYLVPISGPPSKDNNLGGVFGSATGLLLNWQPFTFGQRESQTAFAKAGVTQANSDLANEVLQHKVRVANAYLDALTAKDLVQVFSENLDRCKANLALVQNLVSNGLRPGVDSALFAGEVSKATAELLNHQRNYEQALLNLTQLMGITDNILIGDSSYSNRLPVNGMIADSLQHPLLAFYQSSIDLDLAKRKTIEKTTLPGLGFWGTTYARGSGIQYDGTVKSLDGLGLQRVNYGLGIQLSVPLLQSVKIKPQLQQQDIQARADKEKLNELSLQLNRQMRIADTTLRYALEIVKQNPSLLRSAAFAYTTMVSRYNAGLANYTDIVQAQYNLSKAEADDKTTHIAVWKAFLYKAAVAGDIDLFLKQVK